MDINQKLTEELAVKRWQIDAAVKLIDEGKHHSFYFKIPKRGNRFAQRRAAQKTS